MPIEIATTDQYDAAERLLEGAKTETNPSLMAQAQVRATLAVADRLEALTERLEAILDAGLSGIRDEIAGS